MLDVLEIVLFSESQLSIGRTLTTLGVPRLEGTPPRSFQPFNGGEKPDRGFVPWEKEKAPLTKEQRRWFPVLYEMTAVASSSAIDSQTRRRLTHASEGP